MREQQVRLTQLELKVLLDGINAIGWDTLPVGHPEINAAKLAKYKIRNAIDYLRMKVENEGVGS